MPELMNWPPSRGPNPHTHEWTWTPNVTRKDMPAPKQREVTVAEKDMIEDIEAGNVGPLPKLKYFRRFRRKERKKPLLAGTWRVWYQVEDVARLTLEQADTFVLACQDDCRKRGHHHDRHMENWFDYEPRPLWVDITYPLTRGVRLYIKPALRVSTGCKACEAKVGKEPPEKRYEMTPGYLLWTVAKEYEAIYKDHEKYGVWGHALSDLGFERITIRKDGVVDLGIGS